MSEGDEREQDEKREEGSELIWSTEVMDEGRRRGHRAEEDFRRCR